MKKLRVRILFGGRSGEHEVWLLSVSSVLNAIDKKKYEGVPIGITKEGRWLTAEHAENLLQGKLVIEPRHLRAGDPETTPAAAVLALGESVIVPPEPVHRQNGLMPFQSDAALTRRAGDRAINVDVIFPELHGTFGEDGTIQGLLEPADLPFVGAGALGSAAGMDKVIIKSLFLAPEIPIANHVTILRRAWEKGTQEIQKLIESKLKYPVFVKPATLGSSVGISKAHNGKELSPAIEEAAKFDRKIVIEQGVGGKKTKSPRNRMLGAVLCGSTKNAKTIQDKRNLRLLGVRRSGLEPSFNLQQTDSRREPNETKYSSHHRIGILCAGPCPGRGSARASTGRQNSVSHHAPARSIPDGPRCGDCDVPKRRPELCFERGQGAGSWTAWL